jgi:hypothetical protein
VYRNTSNDHITLICFIASKFVHVLLRITSHGAHLGWVNDGMMQQIEQTMDLMMKLRNGLTEMTLEDDGQDAYSDCD